MKQLDLGRVSVQQLQEIREDGYREGWNAAIEAALSECDRVSDTEIYVSVVENIRKLKK